MPMDWNTVLIADRRDPSLSREGAAAIKDAFSTLVPTSPEEAALSMMLGPFGRPAKLAGTAALSAAYSPDAEAGIIAGGKRVADALGIKSVLDRAVDMFQSGRNQRSIAHESINALNAMRNPGQARSVFMGPEGIPRVVISNENTRIPSSAPFKHSPRSFRFDAHTDVNIPEGEEVLLSDLMLHPSLYDLSPSLSNIKVGTNPYHLLFGGSGGYDPTTNKISLSPRIYPENPLANDPLGNLQRVLMHEANHALQAEAGVRGGAAPSVRALRQAIDDAERKGSFNAHRLPGYSSILDRIESGDIKGDVLERRLHDMYRRNYGEAEARAGSEYVPTALPHYYLGETW